MDGFHFQTGNGLALGEVGNALDVLKRGWELILNGPQLSDGLGDFPISPKVKDCNCVVPEVGKDT